MKTNMIHGNDGVTSEERCHGRCGFCLALFHELFNQEKVSRPLARTVTVSEEKSTWLRFPVNIRTGYVDCLRNNLHPQ